MKNIFIPGDQKKYKKTVGPTDVAAFHKVTLHEVCSTFSLARDFEWSSRLFFIDMKEEDEEGVGTFLSIDHKSPAFVGEEIIFTAQVVKIEKNELICSIEAKTAGRLIATGTTGQKMLKKDRLKQIFTKPS
ncbi:MAG: thioesterase family protein [Flammeovirgaceae bacterium]